VLLLRRLSASTICRRQQHDPRARFLLERAAKEGSIEDIAKRIGSNPCCGRCGGLGRDDVEASAHVIPEDAG
jgi:hypothetical protein